MHQPSRPLQWGHDEGVVEGQVVLPSARDRVRSLQWGHDEGVVEGDSIRDSVISRRLIASMGPRRRCRGRRLRMAYETPLGSHGFNGATTKVSWKAGQRRRSRLHRSTSLQWGHDEGVVEGDRCTLTSATEVDWCFNGATTKVSWKARTLWRQGIRHVRFNGATTKVSWKGRDQAAVYPTMMMLQWGHDEGVVEGRDLCRVGRAAI